MGYLSEVVVAFIGLIGVLATAYLGYRSRMTERETARKELRFQAAALDFSAFLSGWDGVHNDLKSLMDETEIDRFLILRAWNGNMQPKWTTSVFQMRQGKQEPVNYIHIDLDTDYVDRLREAIQNGQMIMNVSQSPRSIIKDVYDAEGVRAAVWFHIETVQSTEHSKALTYCSFATHAVDVMDDTTITSCRLIASRLRGLAATFRHDHE